MFQQHNWETAQFSRIQIFVLKTDLKEQLEVPGAGCSWKGNNNDQCFIAGSTRGWIGKWLSGSLLCRCSMHIKSHVFVLHECCAALADWSGWAVQDTSAVTSWLGSNVKTMRRFMGESGKRGRLSFPSSSTAGWKRKLARGGVHVHVCLCHCIPSAPLRQPPQLLQGIVCRSWCFPQLPAVATAAEDCAASTSLSFPPNNHDRNSQGAFL